MTYKVYKFKLINTILEDLSSAGRWHSWKDPSSFPKKKKIIIIILEEYIGLMSRIQKGNVSHKSAHYFPRSVNSCKSLPLRVDQILDIHLGG